MKNHLKNTVSVLVWDFDGVLVAHSESFKEAAWQEILAPWPGAHDLKVEASKKIGWGKKGDRFDILRYIAERLDGIDDIESWIKERADEFNNIVQRKILGAGLAPHVLEVLKEVKRRGIPQYVNSGTATGPLRQSLEALEILSFFEDAVGGPTSKGDNLKLIAKRKGIKRSKLLLVGDSEGDITGAKEARTPLLGLANKWNKWEAEPPEGDFEIVTDIRQVLDYLPD